MAETAPLPRETGNLAALFLTAWTRHRESRAMDDGIEQVTYQTLLRRALALSIFIEESTGGRPGPVVLYLPAGLSMVRAALGVWFAHRCAVVLDAMAGARLAEDGAHQARVFRDRDYTRIGELNPKPALVISIRPLERQAGILREEAGLTERPVLYADDIARRMDVGHQEKIRALLEPKRLAKLREIESWSEALIETSDWLNKEDAPILTTHAETLDAMRSVMERSGIACPRRTLAMTSPERTETWSAGYLPALATGGEISFIRFFYPAHVAQVVAEKRINALVMDAGQYEALADRVGQRPLCSGVECWVAGEPGEAGNAVVQRWSEAGGPPLRWIRQRGATATTEGDNR